MIETTISSNGSANNNASNGGRGKLQEKLLPKAIATKRRRKQDTTSVYDGSQDDNDDALMPPPSRGRNAANSDDAGSEDDDPLAGSLSNRSLQTRSYTSYVSTPLDQPASREGRTPSQSEFDRVSRTSTLPVNPPVSDAADSIPVPGFSLTKTGLAPPASKTGRSPSPAGRLRDVFKSKKNSNPVAPSPEPQSQHPDASQTGHNNKSLDSPTPSVASATAPFPITEASVSLSPASAEEPPHAPKVKAAEKFRRLSKGHGHKVDARPHTPPSNDTAGPKIVSTPPTPTEASSANVLSNSRLSASPEKTTGPIPSTSVSDASSPPSANTSMISQRRARAGSIGPSKLSNFTLAPPLPPTPENGPISPSSGFFSSMLSAAQSATTSLSSTITSTNITAPWTNNNSSGSINKSPGNPSSGEAENNDGVEVESSHDSTLAGRSSSEAKEPAVKTLGMGDLSLSQLGIVEPPEKETLPTSATLPLVNAGAHGQPRMTEISTETRLRSESAPADPSILHTSPEVLDHGANNVQGSAGRPSSASVSDSAGQDDHTPPTTSIYDDKDKPEGIQRTGSIRSAIGRRRHRGSSAATGGTSTTIAAAIAAANASVAHPMASGSTPKLTGFAVASKKRNREFHSLFKSVPDDDYLIEDYSCALQREILAHGRLYVSEGYLCFSSNILGWVTTLVMSFDEIVSVEKRSTALVFKNGLMISTLHAKHIFASFASRDSTYDLIVKIWKLGHPSLQSSLNGVRIDETGGDKTEKIDEGDSVSVASRSLSMTDDDSEDDSDEVYDEDAEDEDLHESAHVAEPSSAAADLAAEKSVSRKPSGTTPTAASGTAADKPKDAVAAPAGGDFPGPLTHAPTDCGDTATHYERILADEMIAAPLGKVFNYIFGSTSATWMIKWLSNEQKCFDIQSADKKGLSASNKTRTITYTKPLNGSIGPKQTKCIVTEQIESIDFEKAINVVCLTQTPDVPSGNVFTVKTKYCLSWGENNGTRVQINCTIEWTGKSWLKAPIEKGANDGQMQYSKELFASLKEALSSSSRPGVPNGGPGKGKKKGRKNKVTPTLPTDEAEPGAAKKKPQVAADWGMLEPVHGILEPVIDIVQPLLTSNIMYGILVGLLVATWFGFGVPSSRQQQLGPVGYGADLRYHASYAERLAAYDEMWRREESELWDWLEERVGLDRLNGEVAGGAAAAGASGTSSSRKKVLEPRVVEDKLREERMDNRDLQEAIRITEEKLKVLRSVVERQEGV